MTVPNGKTVISYCYQLGAEAKANGRKYMTKDDRQDIALRSGYTSWLEIPGGQQQEAQQAFYDGWAEEEKNEQAI